MPVPGERVLVLLRGINVGGRHVVPMADLRRLFVEQLGCTDVATYIQSGNIVCTAGPRLAEDSIAAALTLRFGFPIPVVLRGLAELDAAVKRNPFAGEGSDIAMLHAVFLAEPLAPAVLQALMARCAGEEQLVAQARELFLLLPHGVGRSKLALAVTAPSMPGNPTMRNWKTVLQLHTMLTA